MWQLGGNGQHLLSECAEKRHRLMLGAHHLCSHLAPEQRLEPRRQRRIGLRARAAQVVAQAARVRGDECDDRTLVGGSGEGG